MMAMTQLANKKIAEVIECDETYKMRGGRGYGGMGGGYGGGREFYDDDY